MPRTDLEFRMERARKIKRALLNKGWTQSHLAAKVGCDDKTIRNVLAGDQVRDQTIIEVSQALGIEPELEKTVADLDLSDDEFGNYTRANSRYYEGFYYLYRKSYLQPSSILRSVMKIEWDDSDERLNFSEYYLLGVDGEQQVTAFKGPVYMSSYTNLIHLLTIAQGSVRLVTLMKMKSAEGIMRGAILTQAEALISHHPSVSPIIFKKLSFYNVDACASDIRSITREDSDYAFADNQLTLTESEIVKSAFVNLSHQKLR